MNSNDSLMRPELNCGDREGSKYPCPTNGTAYLMIYTAVQHQDGLIHGRLHANGAHCAIGSYWQDNPKTALHTALIDEVAMVNDSVPHMSPMKRKQHVARWLRWKLQQCGLKVPGKAVAP